MRDGAKSPLVALRCGVLLAAVAAPLVHCIPLEPEEQAVLDEAGVGTAHIRFHNDLGVDLEVFWQGETDDHPSHHSIGTMAPGRDLLEISEHGHIFVVKTKEKQQFVYEHVVNEELMSLEGAEGDEHTIADVVVDVAAVFRNITFQSMPGDEATFKPITIYYISDDGESLVHTVLDAPDASETGFSFVGHSFEARLEDGTVLSKHDIPALPNGGVSGAGEAEAYTPPCVDQEDSGVVIDGDDGATKRTYSCAEVADYCEKPTFRKTLHLTCPATCGTCPDGGHPFDSVAEAALAAEEIVFLVPNHAEL